jgi:hypothetical protein
MMTRNCPWRKWHVVPFYVRVYACHLAQRGTKGEPSTQDHVRLLALEDNLSREPPSEPHEQQPPESGYTQESGSVLSCMLQSRLWPSQSEGGVKGGREECVKPENTQHMGRTEHPILAFTICHYVSCLRTTVVSSCLVHVQVASSSESRSRSQVIRHRCPTFGEGKYSHYDTKICQGREEVKKRAPTTKVHAVTKKNH